MGSTTNEPSTHTATLAATAMSMSAHAASIPFGRLPVAFLSAVPVMGVSSVFAL
ncbi:hypothetical protein ACIGBH_31160 [Streptomyces sp. NPDC085929]|uniref:hypothetical protein n=1 Tax=Streptomyces sp. NPDC085929 TaxID=3365739 RepID=UPI0037D80A59